MEMFFKSLSVALAMTLKRTSGRGGYAGSRKEQADLMKWIRNEIVLYRASMRRGFEA